MNLLWLGTFLLLVAGAWAFRGAKGRSFEPLWPKILRFQSTQKLSDTKGYNRSAGFDLKNHPVGRELKHGQANRQFLHMPASFERVEGEAYLQLEAAVRQIEKHFLPARQERLGRLLGETLIDQRAFCDCFRAQKQVIVMLYNIDSMRVALVSSSVKKLLGCQALDFRIRFHELLYDLEAWKRPLSQLKLRKRLYAPLAFKVEKEQGGVGVCAWDAYMSEIDRGGVHYAVTLLYPAYGYLPFGSTPKHKR